MSQDQDKTDLMSLYSERILAFSQNLPKTEPLANPDLTASRRSPLCGSSLEVALKIEDGVIADYSHTVRACALGTASAAIFAAQVVGRSRDEVEALARELRAMLKEDGPVPTAPFADYEVLLPARDYANRHASIMLAPEAVLEAWEG
ncbi:iron-sulfur cluster assembly scaffold protein [Paracoccaceae bacterium GXU_MW_L88]